jgi:hypothetical protein
MVNADQWLKKPLAPLAAMKPVAKNTSVEVSHISPHGIWQLIVEREYLLPFTAYPWFTDATVFDIYDVKLLHGPRSSPPLALAQHRPQSRGPPRPRRLSAGLQILSKTNETRTD